MAEVNRDKTIIDVDEVACRGAVDEVDGKKLCEAGKMGRKHGNVEDACVGREVEELNRNEMKGLRRGEDEKEIGCEECETAGCEVVE